MTDHRTPSELRAEVARLSEQLDEAKETLRAITSGEVDALVVNTRQGERIFTLEGADTVYRITIENINEGAITMSPEGTILYSNHYFAQMMRTDLNRVIGASIFNFIRPESRGIVVSLLQENSSRGELSLRSGDGTEVPTFIATRRLQLDNLSICAVVTDLTQQKRSEEVIRTGKLIQSILEQSPNAVIVCDAAGNIIYASEAARRLAGLNLLGEPADSALTNIRISGKPLRFADIKSGDIKGSTCICTRKNGELFFLLSYSTFGSASETKGYVISFTDITELKRAEEELHRYREHLEELVVERTRELRELSHRLVDAQEKERATIGNELHDEIGQYLTYTTLLIDKALRKPDEKVLAEAGATIREAISQIRNLSSMLSPRMLRSAGLLQAIASLIEEYIKRTSIKVNFDHDGRFEKVPEDVALASYRIIQECLTNVARHAKASEVKVCLSREPGRLFLEIADNGVGFDSDAVKRSTGLTGMKERALALGGELTIDSGNGQGTRVTAVIPLSGKENA